uniref:Glucose/Sorbosone dehydrogenase domain-containing protein n=1 Tax=Rhodosorus marinus TaxID=101924 RepID=A0A7S3A118_9RHOD|mmetsp:Transcript_40631/g.161118  ORF Transcript_40631/g.161118 Transcript_40631/m.161118 type:complete len:1500 (+) Transcript_40631:288-4787(+)|eukprot:CAMPEP_0113960110 /NCGR_PEP_ID=MMETSP0011_2-20120614/4526_1 /TAXON_ID=101924 /ORGANISM="Rhodosorus marinus" /LENGTH=1499 /DNA_ID=CAMNT_0000971513 /DNA_START=184 /DNA_END=4683 /DNA_ORIENTATION=- /assembly_acc=CAM_ASM_000156
MGVRARGPVSEMILLFLALCGLFGIDGVHGIERKDCARNVDVYRDWFAYDGMRVGRAIGANVTVNNLSNELLRIPCIETVPRNHPCGLAARLKLSQLLRGERVRLKVCSHPRTEREVLLSQQVRGIVRSMIKSGLAGLGESCKNDPLLAALNEKMRAEGRGCYWRTNNAFDREEFTTVSDKDDELRYRFFGDKKKAASEGSIGGTSHLKLNAAGRETDLLTEYPTGFKVEDWSSGFLFRPVDIMFPSSGVIYVAINEGRMFRLSYDGVVLGDAVLDWRTFVNDYNDRGLMSMKLSPSYDEDSLVYAYIVYEHSNDPDTYKWSRTARVMRVKLNADGTEELPETRQVVVGTRSGYGCDTIDENDPHADCLGAAGRSHVGGGINFDELKNLLVAVGDGGFSWVKEDALKAQRSNTYSGKVIRVSTAEGSLGLGVEDNPWYTGNPIHKLSKIYAYGVRNVLHLHRSPVDGFTFYFGDTQWNKREEINVLKKGHNHGWPCYESDVKNTQWYNTDECEAFDPTSATLPIIAWSHEGSTHSSMAGERIRIGNFPRRYYDRLVYADHAAKWIGFAELDENDSLVRDIERWQLTDVNPVQLKAGLDNALYVVSVYGPGTILRISYEVDINPLVLDAVNPKDGEQVSSSNFDGISGIFSKSVEPETVTSETIFIRNDTGGVVASNLEFNYETRTFMVEPTATLEEDRDFWLVIKGGPSGVLDLDNNVRENDIVTLFRITSSSDTTPPTIVRTIPDSDATDVSHSKSITIEFSEEIDLTDILDKVTVVTESGFVFPMENFRWIDTSRQLKLQDDLFYGTRFTVTVLSGAAGVSDVAGNRLASEYTWSFTTEEQGATVVAEILSPTDGEIISVGDTINFKGRAFDAEGYEISSSYLRWQIVIKHCPFTENPTCHDHVEYYEEGVSEGSIVAPIHFDNFFYEVGLFAVYNNQIGQAFATVKTSRNEFTLESQPSGLPIALNGVLRTTPFTEKVVRFSPVLLYAPSGAGSMTFMKWAEGGQREKEVTVERATTFKAVYGVLYSMETSPTGMRATLDRKGAIAPFSKVVEVGAYIQIAAPATSEGLVFQGWLDGVASRIRWVTVGQTALSFRALFGEASQLVTLVVESQPDGASVTVNDETQTAPFTVEQQTGSITALSCAPTLDGMVWVKWMEDGGDRQRQIVATQTRTFTCVYGYELEVNSSPWYVDIQAKGKGGETPYTWAFEEGETVELTAPEFSSGLKFLRWSDGDLNRVKLVEMNGPQKVTAVYGAKRTITSDPPGLTVRVNADTYTTPVTMYHPVGQYLRLEPKPLENNDILEFSHWKEYPEKERITTILVRRSELTYTAVYKAITNAVPITITSQPEGLELTFTKGNNLQVKRATPFVTYMTVGNTARVAAPESPEEFRFSRWEDGVSTREREVTATEVSQTLKAIYSNKVILESVPSGLDIMFNWENVTTPAESYAEVGSEMKIYGWQHLNNLKFDQWAEGGRMRKTVVKTEETQTFIAQYVPA